MTGDPTAPRFRLRVGYDQDELLGARWWHEGLRAAVVAAAGGSGGGVDESRRNALRSLAVLGSFAVVGGLLLSRCDGGSPPRISQVPSLDLQRRSGVYVQAGSDRLQFPDASTFDGDGLVPTPDELAHLAEDLKPDAALLEPYYVPTLFQCLGAAGNEPLRADFRLVHSAAMDRAFAQGRAVRELLEHAQRPEAVALVVDLPGPEAVAFAAGLRPFAHAVFTFDNWPHPRGVVPAHLTLAAAAYHRAAFRRATGSGPRPAAFVLDRLRLAAYRDEPDRFDNRYLAKLPTGPALRALGVERVFYVVPADAPAEELDDLSATFVAWRGAGLSIQLLSLRDLLPGEPLPASGTPPTPASTSAAPTTPYYWHGSPATHWWFWNHYGWPGRAYPLVPVAPTRPTFGSGFQPRVRVPGFGSVDAPGRTRTTTPGSGGSSWFGGSGRSGSSGRTWSGGSS